MPVLPCQKNNKSGHKWGQAGVCFTGSDSRERALSVGRAIAAQRARVPKTFLGWRNAGLLQRGQHELGNSRLNQSQGREAREPDVLRSFYSPPLRLPCRHFAEIWSGRLESTLVGLRSNSPAWYLSSWNCSKVPSGVGSEAISSALTQR